MFCAGLPLKMMYLSNSTSPDKLEGAFERGKSSFELLDPRFLYVFRNALLRARMDQY